MKVKILITTYNRPNLFLNLLRSIHAQSKDLDLSLFIVNDGSQLNYKHSIDFLEKYFPGKYEYFLSRENMGKKGYWQIINSCYQALEEHDFDYLIQLPDDITLVDDFFSKAIETFDSITDKKKICLNILNDFARKGKSFWTRHKVRVQTFNGIDVYNIGWVDMCFIASKDYLKALDFKINPVNGNWTANKNLSSGVGKQISQRLHSENLSLFQVVNSLVVHDDHYSVMHPEHRDENKLISNHRKDKITATCATMPGREKSLIDAVNSLYNQVDEIHIYFNEIDSAEHFELMPKVKCFFSKDAYGDLGDAGKFYKCDEISGYHFTFDDDLKYPINYVDTLINEIELHSRKYVVSCHGRNFGAMPINSYYKDYSEAYSCLRTLPKNVFAHVVGTGVLAYHTDTIKLSLSIFEYSNMADIWFSKFCEKKNVPRLIIKHRKDWIKLSPYLDSDNTIFQASVFDDSFQTKIVNTVKWSNVL